MNGYQMKRKIAIALCAMMTASSMPFGALAEALAPEAELVRRIELPDGTEKIEKIEKIEKLEPAPEKVLKIDLKEIKEVGALMTEIKKDAPVVQEIKKETPVVQEIKKDTPVIEEIKKETPVVQEIKMDTPVIEEIKKDTPVIEEIKKDTPVVQEIRKDDALITEIKKPDVSKLDQIEPSADLEKKEDTLTTPKLEVLTPPIVLAPSVSAEPVYSKIEAAVTTGADSITVTITQASAEPMYVFVGDDFKDGMHKGDSATFSGLTPGEYDVEVDYEEGTNVFRTSATIKAPDTPPSSGTVEPVTPPSSGTVEPIVPPSSGTVEPVTPPSSGTVEPIVPPSSGTVEPVTPPSSGTVEPIVPPSSGTVEPVTPPSSGADEQVVKTFTILPVETDGVIAVVIDGASDREVEVALLDKDGKQVGSGSIIGSGLVNLGKFSSGSYTARAQYVTPVQTEDGSFDHKTVTAQVVVEAGVTAPDPEKPVDIQAKIEKGKDYIIITVTESADADMMASVDGLGDKPITKGGSVRYDGLTPGQSYGVEIDYVNYVEGAKKYSATVTIDKPETLGEIKITAVTPGTNMLTVSGTATAGKQVILTTTPAAAGDVYAVANEKGVFKAEIPCSAGVYTAVTAKYSADTSKSHKVTSKWTVAAPTEKPKLTIDPIDTSSTIVIAKTTPGVVVEIKTSDYSQKVTADAKGIVRFSLPHTYKAGKEFKFTVFYGDNQSFTQKAKVADIPYLGTLTYGDTGDDVKTLTKRLKELGYLDDSTSRYGSTVREAVRLFQRANGLDADGIAGPLTQQKLFSVSAIAFGSDTYPTLVRGDRGYALIYTLQQRLKDLGYYTIKVDGIYGSGTQRAVREFQRINGLSITGKADNATQALLYSSAAKPAGSSIAPSCDYQTLSRSSRYKSAVVPLQKRLRALGYYAGNIDGYFGSQTYRAVRNFQSRNRLTVTGVADPYTQQVLYSASAKAYSGSSSSGSSSSSSTSAGYRLLYWGCRGDAVKKLQQALINAGYKSIVRSADGIFGQWTYDAVRTYQKDHGLAVDGIAGKNTQNSLYGTSY